MGVYQKVWEPPLWSWGAFERGQANIGLGRSGGNVGI